MEDKKGRMRNIVYGLRDPRNDVYYYIGKSTVGVERPLTHLTHSHSEKVNEWVKMLADRWLYPQIDIIEEVDDLDQLGEREEYWINYYHELNPSLLNTQLVSNIVETRTDEDETIFEMLRGHVSSIPEILRKERIYRKLSQEELAECMGISRSTLSLMERGENVTFDTVQKCFLALRGFDILTKTDSQRARCRSAE